MDTEYSQRWLFGQARYRPAGETVNTRAYEIGEIGANAAKQFVQAHHYAGSKSWVYDRFRFGLFRGGRLVGAAVFSHPVNERILSIFPGDRTESCELGRFVLLDEEPTNTETWFLARCFAALRKDHGQTGVVSFSDPVARKAASGAIVFPGHIGTIYCAHNATYLGRATARTLRLWPDGRVVNSRRLQKIRSGEQGAAPAIAEIVGYGADGLWDDRRAWLRHWIPQLTSRLPHPGNHKYVWALSKYARLPAGLPYPKAPALIGGLN